LVFVGARVGKVKGALTGDGHARKPRGGERVKKRRWAFAKVEPNKSSYEVGGALVSRKRGRKGGHMKKKKREARASRKISFPAAYNAPKS